MSTDLKWFISKTGVGPSLSSTWGALVDLLDACLVYGYNENVVTSIDKDGDNITLNYATAHNYSNYQILLLSGFDDSNLNGEQQILSVTTNTVTIRKEGISQLSGGNSKLAPVGFEIKYQDTKRRIYRSLDTSKNPFYLRVDDTLDPVWSASYAKFAKVGILEEVEGIEVSDILGHQAPASTAIPHPNWVGTGSGTTAVNGWAKWYYAYANGFSQGYADISNQNTGVYSWMLVGDKSGFFLLPSCGNDGCGATYCFTMFDSFLDGDNFNCLLSATFDRNSAQTSYAKYATTPLTIVGNRTAIVLREKGQTATHALIAPVPIGFNKSNGSANTLAMSSGKTDILDRYGAAQFSTILLNENDYIRGRLPLLHWLYNYRPMTNFEVFVKGKNIYMARNTLTDNPTIGQVVMKIGEL